MAATLRRKFTILDGMILVAAIACGFALRRITDPALGDFGGYEPNWLGRVSGEYLADVVPFLMTLTLAVLVMRARRPRPRWRRIFRQPGTAACVAAAVPLAIVWLPFASSGCIPWFSGWFRAGPGESMQPTGMLDGLPPGGVFWGGPMRGDALLTRSIFLDGLWVLAAWLALALSGRRRPERSRLDRLGRMVGLGWLLVWALGILGSLT